MLRFVNLFFVVAVVIGAALVYDIKMSNENLADQVRQLSAEIAKEKDDIRYYKAQWSVLNQPGRLQGIVDRYNDILKLEPLRAEQITTLKALPVRPVLMEPVSADAMSGYASRVTSVQ
ncbi:cell division protein FtsL [Pseudovibrio ascidiaceicola]|jgi:hypothetical protein|uniref:Cell division protein FtsL n=1 Tax=Pseudovibrio ascidiaceicola TaxID=285279 RepID=A0A1I3XPR9_9HYPH|nr:MULTISPECIES: hypothetical protein [Pseudovibrio]KZK94740.1 hypothetical protein PsW74_04401 [Pseudovibrio sp. W74]KZK99064.1 hypothetical protein PsAD26_04870 [Pseudovibrio sp. Ad26]KZL04701.1 hypothetical protein PsAD14_04936 [Pseudovibrio sp. Ad14]KZL14704.1 hypothetical protein PsAD37_04816 [Pseudovibrio sp. Ad37]KZL21678.1 hypothetical protein PsWM33_04250 [Pseudovibrio sp. WM33]